MGLYDFYRSYISKCESEMEILSSVHDEPTLLPQSLRTESLYLTCYAFASVSLLHLFLLTMIRFNKKSKKKLRDDFNSIQNSYQATNFCVNLSLGLYGLYTWIRVVPGLYTVSATDKIIGFHQFVPFSAAQLGYNMWSIPMGALVIGESKAMLGHHVAAFIVSFLASFFTIGYRYYNPFFLGFYELSSVPLAIMNSFKNNREWANKNSPISFITAKVLFAVFYLLIRVFLGTPQMYDNMRIATLLFITCESNYCRFIVGIFAILAYFLALLQYVWGYMVVSGLYSVYKGKANTTTPDANTEKKD
mmetsp:Transcript_6612/g.7673  ORF Transcript_6612/g.7673 Transcript_6612/m.7673 type:complete len:304 (+) Transcript_6612:136-1047(+)